MKYIFNSKDEGEIEIPLERWTWVAIYKSGHILSQFDPTEGKFHQVGEIDQGQIGAMILHKPGEPQHSISIPWEDGMKLVHKYRNITIDAFGEDRKYRIYIIGWKRGNEQMFHFILPDDRIVTSTNENLPLAEYL